MSLLLLFPPFFRTTLSDCLLMLIVARTKVEQQVELGAILCLDAVHLNYLRNDRILK